MTFSASTYASSLGESRDEVEIIKAQEGYDNHMCRFIMARASSKNIEVNKSLKIDREVLETFLKIKTSSDKSIYSKDKIVKAFNQYLVDGSQSSLNNMMNALMRVMVMQTEALLPYLNNSEDVIDIFQQLQLIYIKQLRRVFGKWEAPVADGFALSVLGYLSLNTDSQIYQYVFDMYVSDVSFKSIANNPLRSAFFEILRSPLFNEVPDESFFSGDELEELDFFRTQVENIHEMKRVDELTLSDHSSQVEILEKNLSFDQLIIEIRNYLKNVTVQLKKDPRRQSLVNFIELKYLGDSISMRTDVSLAKELGLSRERVRHLKLKTENAIIFFLVRRYKNGYNWDFGWKGKSLK